MWNLSREKAGNNLSLQLKKTIEMHTFKGCTYIVRPIYISQLSFICNLMHCGDISWRNDPANIKLLLWKNGSPWAAITKTNCVMF